MIYPFWRTALAPFFHNGAPRVEGNLNKILNLQRDVVDTRDDAYAVVALAQDDIPDVVDMTQWCPPTKKQGSIGSCGSHAIVSAIEASYLKDRPNDYVPLSELFHYYVVRSKPYMGTYPADSGQTLRDGLKAAQKQGIAPESLCPYNVAAYNNTPSALAYGLARIGRWHVRTYERCWGLPEVLTALAGGQYVVLGLNVWSEFLSSRSQVTKMGASPSFKGGHAVYIAGYDKIKEELIIHNSWGQSWGRWGFTRITFNDFRKTLIDAYAVVI